MTYIASPMRGLRFKDKPKLFWLFGLFPALFLSDILYGGLDYFGIHTPVSPGIVMRGFVFFLAIVMVAKYRRRLDTLTLAWCISLVIFSLPSIIVGMWTGGNLITDFLGLLKVLYGPFVILLVVILIRKYRIPFNDVLRFIEYSAYLLGISLLISLKLTINRATYGEWAFGSTGIFSAQNDITLAFGLSLLAAIYRLVVLKVSLKNLLIRLTCLAVSLYACIQIGTRGSLIVIFGCGIFSVVVMLWSKKSSAIKKTYSRHMKWLLVLALSLGMGWILMYGLNMQRQHSFQQEKLANLYELKLPRSYLMDAGWKQIVTRPGWMNLTGEGMTSFGLGVSGYFRGLYRSEKKLVEVDWMDFLGAYGIFFTILIHLFFLWVLWRAAWEYVTGSKDPLCGLVATASAMYLGHSAFAGHALISPIPTTLIAGYVGVYLVMRKDKDRVHAA